jgi:hypothetical protein
MTTPWQELEIQIDQAKKALDNSPENHQYIKAEEAVIATPQTKRVQILNQINSDAFSLRQKWMNQEGTLLTLGPGTLVLLKILSDTPNPEELLNRSLIGITIFITLAAFGYYANWKFATTRANKYISQELQKLN